MLQQFFSFPWKKATKNCFGWFSSNESHAACPTLLCFFFILFARQQFKVRLLIDDKMQFIWELKAIAIYSWLCRSEAIFFRSTRRAGEMQRMKWENENRLSKNIAIETNVCRRKGWGKKKARNKPTKPTIYNFYNFLTCNYPTQFFLGFFFFHYRWVTASFPVAKMIPG